jgi:hypothetical protein
LAEDAIVANAIAPLSLHPTSTSVINTAVNKDHHCCAAIDCRFHRRWQPLPPSTTNNNCWLLAVVIVDCVTAAMAIVGGSNSGRCRWRRQWD